MRTPSGIRIFADYSGLQIFALVFFVFQKGLLAGGADHVFGIYGVVEVNLTAAVGAHSAVEFFVVIFVIVITAVAAVTFVIAAVAVVVIIVVTAIAAVTIVQLVFINDFFNRTQVFVDFFDICVAYVEFVAEGFDFGCHLAAYVIENI